MPDTLAQKIKAKYPGAYDDVPDGELEAKIKAKYPGVYDDLPTTPNKESAFRSWYAQMSREHDLNPDPDSPDQFYDYRAAFSAGAKPDATGHWPSAFKRPGHPNMVVGGFNVQTGERVAGTPRAKSVEELVALGWEPDAAARLAATPEPVAGRPAMNAAVVNGQPVPVDDGPAQAVSGFVQNVNPVPMLVELGNALISGGKGTAKVLSGNADKAVGDFQQAAEPLRNMLRAQGALYDKGKAAAAQGDYITAARHLVDWLIPVLGPALDDAADDMQAGRPWSGMGKTLGIGAQIAAPKAIERVSRVKLPAVSKNSNALEAEAMAFAQREGIPVDAGVATGNAFLRGTQALADRTPIGAVVAEKARGARAEALRSTGGRLAERVYPEAVTPETAGQSVRESVQRTRDAFGAEANTAYDRLRDIERSTVEEVPVEQNGVPQRAKMGMQREFGRALSAEEISEVRRIRAELDAQRFQQGRIARGNRRPGDVDSEDTYVRGQANAAVYHDIRQLAPGTAGMTGAQMIDAIDQALTDGRWTNAARGAYEVAKARLDGKSYVRGTRLNQPSLPPGAGDIPPDLVQMNMPVDLRQSKQMLKPLYERLSKQLPPAVRNADEGFTALKTIMEYPDFAPLSDVDPALGAIKALSRSESPELRNVSQGVAAQAVKVLDSAVRQAAEKGGPDALTALETGRAATRAKYSAQDVLKAIREEPVQAFRQAVYSKDAGIDQLRKVQELAPGEMPKLGRAFVEDVLATATEKGGFDKGGTLFNKWASLGPETKRILFGEQAADLNRFFLVADRLARVTNPSETALVGAGTLGSIQLLFVEPVTGASVMLGSGALSKVLRSPKAVRLLTQGMELRGQWGASRAAQAAAYSAAARAARVAGVSVPAAASGRRPPETDRPTAGR